VYYEWFALSLSLHLQLPLLNQQLSSSLNRLLAGVLHVSDDVAALLVLLQAGENHLGARDVLLRVDQVLEEVLVGPDDARALVGLGELVALRLAALAAEHAVEVGAVLVRAARVARVALRALGLEQLGALLGVALRHFDVRLFHRHFANRQLLVLTTYGYDKTGGETFQVTTYFGSEGSVT